MDEDDAACANDRACIKFYTCLHLEGRVLASPGKQLKKTRNMGPVNVKCTDCVTGSN